uniref:Uncharacterized protein n=1 Tax=Arundo donax TaxID=35708 RepID=A0A0A8Y9R5_ARUDO
MAMKKLLDCRFKVCIHLDGTAEIPG